MCNICNTFQFRKTNHDIKYVDLPFIILMYSLNTAKFVLNIIQCCSDWLIYIYIYIHVYPIPLSRSLFYNVLEGTVQQITIDKHATIMQILTYVTPKYFFIT